ncbi:MAG: hypothetical protein HN719_06525, partial [Alphaproteobacteria bacterium]|nr:hypothetical protein [Alphaproteobacteria bacterium]
MKIFVSLAFLIASFVAAPTMGFAQENLEELLEELEAELGEDFEELLEDLDPDEIAAIEAALEEALDDADNAAELIDVINAAEGALGDLDGAGAIANEARAIVGGGGGGGGGGAGAGAGVVVVARDPTETICMVGEDCDLRGRGETVRDEYGNTICLRGNCDFADPEIVAGVV